MQSLEMQENHVQSPSYWSAVFAMTLAVFALIASEFMPVSLLTPIASDLKVTEGLAGQGISISAAFAVITSLTLTRLAGQLNRKTLLLVLTGIMAVSGLIVALAHNYTLYMIGRALIGLVIGGFWSMSAAIAMRLVPIQDVPRALAIFNSGNALAMVIAAPLGSYLGSMLGWRGAFLSLVPIAIIVFIWQWISLPSMPVSSEHTTKRASALGLFRQNIVLLGMLAVSSFFMGQFALYTYVRPFLENVTHVNISTLSMILFSIGIMGFIGTSSINIFLKRAFYPTLILIPVLMAVIAFMLIFGGTSALFVAVLLGLWGFLATAAPVGWWSWLARVLPQDAEAGGGLMVAVIQLAIALGSTLGGLFLDQWGYQSIFIFTTAVLLIAAYITLKTAQLSSK